MDKTGQRELWLRDEEFEEQNAVENEQDLEIREADFENLFVAPSDWTIESLVRQIGHQIDLDPAFQRRGVWSPTAKSSFIESIFLNIPIPQVLLATKKEDRNSFIVLDGKQRLLTIKQFMEGKFEDNKKFKLTRLRILTALEGKSWADIEESSEWASRFLNQTQRTAVLKGWDREDALYEIFHRLNAGSVKLSPMELRMSLYPGDFLKTIVQWTETLGPIHTLLSLKRPDKRMADVELAVRFLGFQDQSLVYSGNLKSFLDETCQTYNTRFGSPKFRKALNTKLDHLNEAIEASIEIFGQQNACRKWKDGKYERRFNRAVFDVLIGSLANPEVRKWVRTHHSRKARFQRMYEDLSKKDGRFVEAIETTTKSLGSVEKRFSTWYKAVGDAAKVKLKTPSMRHEVSN